MGATYPETFEDKLCLLVKSPELSSDQRPWIVFIGSIQEVTFDEEGDD